MVAPRHRGWGGGWGWLAGLAAGAMLLLPAIPVLAKGGEGGASLIRPLDYCPPDGPPCLMMDVTAVWPPGKEPPGGRDPGGADRKHPAVVKVGAGEDPGSVEFQVRVRGALGGGESRSWRLVLTGEAEGNCSGFRNALVPVVGFTADGSGILLTDQGELTLEKAPLLFGCTHCLFLIDPAANRVGELRTPSWWRTEGGYGVATAEGRSFWQLMGFSCLQRDSPQSGAKPLGEGECRGAPMVREKEPWSGRAWVESPQECLEIPPTGRLVRLSERRCPGTAVSALPPAERSVAQQVAKAGLLDDDYLVERLGEDLHQLPPPGGRLMFLLGARCE